MKQKKKLNRRIAGLTAILLATVTITFGSTQLLKIYDQSETLLPLIPTHPVVAKAPAMTWQDSLKVALPSDLSTPPPLTCPEPGAQWLHEENLNTGSDMTPQKWRNLHVYLPTGAVLWLNKVSANCGDTIDIHASMYRNAPNDKAPRNFQVMRIGDYFSSGSRIMWQSGLLKVKHYNVPKVKNITRTVETFWPTLTSFTIGKDWKPGLYIVAARKQSGEIENFAPLILRGSAQDSKLLLVHSTMTWAAYNRFGGRSAYYGPIDPKRERSRVVSMDRPITGSGINHVDRDAIALVQWLESEGIAFDQISDTDLNRWPSLIKKYNGIVFSGHPEYMTNREFKSILAARNMGINIAMLGSNSAYWQVRTGPSGIGADRKVAIYRYASQDPVTKSDLVSTQFHNAIINMKPSLITGEQTAGVHVHGKMKLVKAPSWLNINPNAELDNWPGNSEIDSQVTGEFAPTNSHLIFSGKMELVSTPKNRAGEIPGRSDIAQTIWYTTPSGAAVFVAGINYWACELSYTCMEGNVDEKTRLVLQDVTRQVLQLWSKPGIGKVLDKTS